MDLQTGFDAKRLVKELTQYQLIGISSIADNQHQIEEICRSIRLSNPCLPIVIGGPDATLNPEAYISFADVVMLGEAEGLIGRLVNKILSGSDLNDVPGIVYRDSSGRIYHTFNNPIRTDIDAFPEPARHLLQSGCYDFLGSKSNQKTASILTARGCPFHCTFCARAALLGNTFRQRDINLVLDEIEKLHDSGCRILTIADSNFMTDSKRVIRIMEGILKRGMKLRMSASVSVHNASNELFECMYAAGMRALSFGIESGNDETLQLFKKGSSGESNRAAIELANKVGMFIKANFILGAPNEDWTKVMNTVQFALDNPIDVAHFSTMTYFYGSPLWEEALSKGLIKNDERAVYATKERGLGQLSLEELVEAYSLAMKRFYCRPILPIRMTRKLLKKSNRDLIPLAARAMLSTLQNSSTASL